MVIIREPLGEGRVIAPVKLVFIVLGGLLKLRSLISP